MERINLYKFKWDKLDATRQKLQAQHSLKMKMPTEN